MAQCTKNAWNLMHRICNHENIPFLSEFTAVGKRFKCRFFINRVVYEDPLTGNTRRDAGRSLAEIFISKYASRHVSLGVEAITSMTIKFPGSSRPDADVFGVALQFLEER